MNLRYELILVFAVAVAVAVVGCGDSRSVEGHGGFVQGVVSDVETGNPLDSAAMRLVVTANDTLAAPRLYTDTSGYYIMFSGFQTGNFYVMARKGGYSGGTIKVKITSGDTVTANIKLTRAQ